MGVGSINFIRSYGFNQTSGSSTTQTLTATMTPGDVGLITIAWNNSTSAAPSTVTDSAGNTWTLLANTLEQNPSLGTGFSQQKAIGVIAVGGSVTITVTFNASASFPAIFGAEFSGVDLKNPVNGSAGSQASAVPISPSLTTTKPNCLIFADIFTNNSGATNGAGWTNVSTGVPLQDGYHVQEYKIVTATGTYQGTQTGAGSQQYDGAIVALQAALDKQFVQGANNTSQSGTTVALAFPGNNAAGNLLLCTIRSAGFATSSVTDSAGNTWTLIDSSSNGEFLALYYTENCLAAGNTVTAHFGGNATFVYMAVAEYSGIARHNSLNVHGITTGSSTTPTSPSVSPSTGDLIVGYMEDHNGQTITPGTGYTIRENNIGAALEDAFNQGPGNSYTASFTMGGSDSWVCGVASFKPWAQNTSAEAGDHSSIVVNSGATSTKAFGAAVNAGDLLLVCVFGFQTNWALTDDKGNTYTKLLGYSNRGDAYFESFWYAVANAAGTPTITFKNNSGSQETALQFEMSVFSPPSGGVIAVDQTATNTGSSATPEATVSSTSMTELVIGMQLPFGFPTSALTGFAGTRAFGSGQQPIIFAVESNPASYTPGVNMSGSNIFSFLAATFQLTAPVSSGGIVVIIME